MKLTILSGGEPLFKDNVNVTRPVIPSKKIFYQIIQPSFESGILTNSGPLSIELEKSLIEYLEVEDCALFCNGTTALQLAIKSYRLSGEIITTPFTFPATVHVIAWNEIVPVFCDIDPETYNIDVTQIEKLITSKTTAILPVHTYGVPCDVEALTDISKRHGIRIIYDAAPSFDVKYKGKAIGNYGDASMYSFHGTKLFSTCEGGALTSTDDFFMERVRLLRNFGITSETKVSSMGINGKISELQSAYGLAVLDLIRSEIQKRKKLYKSYYDRLKKTPGIHFQKIPEDTEYNYQYFPIRINKEEFGLNRDELKSVLNAENIFPRKYYYPLCSQYPMYRGLPFSNDQHLFVANQISDSVICLPLFGKLCLRDAEKIITVIEQSHLKYKEILKKIG